MLTYRLTLSVLVLGVLAVSCTTEEAALEIQERERAIVNGSVDQGHPAVGILHSGGTAGCTATLIGSQTVLTAAHCVLTETTPHLQLTPVNFYLGGFSGAKYAAASVAVHPNYAGGNKADLAVVRLAEKVTDVSPVALTTQAPALGETVTLVGYGRTSETGDEFGTKRIATNVIARVNAEVFSVLGASGINGNVCNGDSGGPTFEVRGGEEVLVGVHSTKGGACGQEGTDMRVDAFRAWIIEQSEGDLTDTHPDLAAPQVSFMSPSPNAELGSSFSVEVSAQDDVGLSRVVLYVNGEKAGEQATAPFRFQVQEQAPGAVRLQAVAVDQAGHESTASVDVTVRAASAASAPKSPTCSSDADCGGGTCVGGTCESSESQHTPDDSGAAGMSPDESLSGGCNMSGARASEGASFALGLFFLIALARRRR